MDSSKMMVGPSFNDEQGVDVFVQNEAAVNTVKPIRTKGKTTKTPAGAIPNTRLQIRHKVGHGAATFVDVPRSDTSLSSSSRALADRGQQILAIQCLFQKASEYLHPSKAFRATVSIYAERKMFVLFLIHFVVTVIVSLHFALVKAEQLKGSIPEGASYYWLKRIALPIEFGAMHAVLLQMALLPLTMARYSISVLAGSVLDRFIPLNRTLRMHIYLGYMMVIIVFAATIFYLTFFAGVMCKRGETDFCDKFTSEIMCTGYGILATLLLITVTARFRHKIPYEVFYVVHHLVFIMYAITVAHTFDIEQRRGKTERSQTYSWFSASILYYVCDRVAMHLNHKYRTRLVSSSALAGSNGSRMLILTMKRPTLFRFKPGQYAYLRISKISNQWHPFSIASDPSSPTLQFYVEVCGKTSWTANIWEMLKEDRDCKTSNRQIIVEIMGPAGTPLAKTDDYSHVLAIGSGTGIVPILSLFKQQVHQLLRLDPETHFRDLKIYLNKVEEVEFAKRSRKGSVAGLLYRSFFHQKSYLHLKEEKGEFVKESILKTMSRCNEGDELSRQEYRSTVAQMKKAAFQATRSIYGTVFLGILPATGVSLIGLMVSWSTGSFELSSGMVKFVKVFTAVFQACFAVFPFFILDATKFLTSIDIVMTIIAPFADWYWWQKSQGNHALDAGQLTLYCLLMGYMVMRLWSIALVPRNRSWRIRAEDKEVRTLERFDMVWVARSASMVSEILIDINEVWKALVDSWGEKNAAAVCRISVYVTDKDIKARKQLKDRLRDTLFIKSGSIHFGRPNFSALIQANTIELIATRRRSQNLLAYVGSPQLAQEIHHHKISNDIVTAITGNEKHQMEFVSESYGGVKATTENIGVEDAVPNEIVKTSTAKSLQSEFEEHDALSIRMTTSYDDSFDVGSKV